MSLRDYREHRVKVTPEIKKAVIALMRQEHDTGQKKVHTAKWYRAEIAKKLKLPESNNPSVRSYEVVIGQLRDAFEVTNPLDKEWYFGSLLEYPIRPESVAKIVQYKLLARKTPFGDYVTIREALWMDKFSALPLSLSKLHLFAYMYASMEQLKDLIGDEYEFTPDFDNQTLLKGLMDNPEKLKEEFVASVDGFMNGVQIIEKELTPERVADIQNKIKAHKKQVKKEGAK